MAALKEKLTSAELDRKIVSMIQNGSSFEKEAGFTLLFNKYKSHIFFKLNKSLRFDSDTANDLMMDVFTKIHLKFDTYKKEEFALSTWVFTITKNTLIDHIKKEKYNSEVLRLDSLVSKESLGEDQTRKTFEIEDKSETNNSLNSLVRDERASALIIALNKIKRDEVRKALVLYYFEEKTYKEISLELEIAESQVKGFLHRGKKELKELLEDEDFNF